MSDELYILWTNDNAITSEKMILMYGANSFKAGWWSEVTLIIWGAPAQLIAENKKIQTQLIEMMEEGVHVSACKACADELGVTSILEGLGIEVKYWGEPLTHLIKTGKKLLTI